MDEQIFLHAMLMSPEDDLARLVYADWLEEQGDPRTLLLRSPWDVPRISRADWLVQFRQSLEATGEHHENTCPHLHSEHLANRDWRDLVARIAPPTPWLAAIDTLGRPFRPFHFWGSSSARSFGNEELPFRRQLGSRGAVITFESAFDASLTEGGLHADLAFLWQLPLAPCQPNGSSNTPIHPFLCELDTDDPLTARRVLDAIHAREFRSQYVADIDSQALPFSENFGLDNDQIHTDPDQQYILANEGDAEEARVYADLCKAVVDGQVWFLVLHSRQGIPQYRLPTGRGEWVVLLAVGKSLRGRRLIGVISHQLCSNLCH